MIKNDKIVETTIYMLDKNPFYANMLVAFDRKEDKRLPSFMGVGANKKFTDVTLYYNPELMEQVSAANNTAILIHEIHHVLRSHPYRMKDIPKEDKLLANIAADCAINSDIREEVEFPTGDFKPMLPEDFGLPPKLTFERYFELLKQQREELQPLLDKLQDLLDRCEESHKRWEDIQKIPEAVVKATVKEKVKRAYKKAGNCPGNIEELVKDLLQEKETVDWRRVLGMFAARIADTTRRITRKKPNRRWGWLFPGNKRKWITDLVVIGDMSGSIDVEDWLEFVREIRKICSILRKVTFIGVDAEIQYEVELKDVKKLKLTGRGGTVFEPALTRAKELKPGGIIFFTDGYPFDGFGEELPNLLWVISSNGVDLDSVPHKRKVKLEPRKEEK